MNLLNSLKLKPAMDWFDRRDGRERILLIAVVVAVFYFIVDLGVIGASESKTRVLKRRIKAQTAEVAKIRKDIAEISQLAGQNANSPQQAQLDGMKRTIAEADALLDQLDTAPRVGDVVKALLGASPGLELVSLKTLPVTVALDAKPLLAAAKPPADAKATANAKAAPVKPALPVRPPRSIYRHGIEVTVKGNYLALLPYLEKLQGYPGRLNWSDVSVDVQTHPDAILKMTIYTMSGQADPSLG